LSDEHFSVDQTRLIEAWLTRGYRIAQDRTHGRYGDATAALVDAAACGVITPAEAAELGKLIDVHSRAIETHEFELRIAKLERADEESKQ
jgi:hypothetical protein